MLATWLSGAAQLRLTPTCYRNLAACNLSGSLPPPWLLNTSMPSLLLLDLAHNQLTGTVPSAMLFPQLQASSTMICTAVWRHIEGLVHWRKHALLTGAAHCSHESTEWHLCMCCRCSSYRTIW